MTDGPRFDPTINLGHVITALTFLVIAVGSYYVTDWRLAQIERQMEKLSAIVIDNARLDERMKDHGRRLEVLERR